MRSSQSLRLQRCTLVFNGDMLHIKLQRLVNETCHFALRRKTDNPDVLRQRLCDSQGILSD
jgi:hypothetical protein